MDFKKQTYAIQVSQFIRKMIQEGKLSPGAPVKENDLATFLNISRAPIREALQILTQDGLIVSEPQKGKTIRVLSAKEIIDGYALTAILEAEGIIMSLDNWTDEDNKDLLNILKKMENKSKKAADITDLAELDELLHNMLLSRCTNEQLIENARRFLPIFQNTYAVNTGKNPLTPNRFTQDIKKLWILSSPKIPNKYEKPFLIITMSLLSPFQN